jgi:acyl dehydratase
MSDGTPRSARLERTMAQVDFDEFAALSGDANPIHIDAEFAASTAFEKPVAHGAFLCSILRGLIADLVPDGRQIWQNVMFPNPAPVGETLVFAATLSGQGDNDGRLITLEARRQSDDAICVSGETEVSP